MKYRKPQKRLLCASILSALVSTSVSALEFDELGNNAIDLNDSALFARINDQEVFVIGTLDQTAADRFHEYLTNNPDTRRVVIGAVPGSSDDAANRTILRTIIDRGLDTHLAGFGYSGGADLWFSGRIRTIADDAEAGVHTWAFETTEQELNGALSDGDITQTIYDTLINAPRNPDGTITVPGALFPRNHPEHQQYIDLYRASGIPNAEEFYFFTLDAASADDIHVLTGEELNRWMLIRQQLFTNVSSQIMPDDLKAALTEVQGSGIGGVLQSFYSDNSAQLRQSVRQITPLTSSLANTSFGNMRYQQRLIERQLNTRRTAAEDSGNSQVWVDHSEDRFDIDSTGMENGYNGTNNRVSLGYDIVTESWGLWGVGLSDNSNKLKYNLNGGNSELNEKSLSLYHTMQFDNLFTESSLTYGSIDGDINRRISSLTQTQNASAEIGGHSYSANISIGRNFAYEKLSIVPKLGISYSKVSINSYRESNSLLATTVDAVDFTSSTAKLGLTANYHNTLWIPGTLSTYAFWQYDFGNTDRSYTARFVQGNSAFQVRGTSADESSIYAGISYESSLTDNTAMSLGAEHERVGDYKNTTYSLNLRYVF